MKEFKHLDLQNQANYDGVWIPAIPLPFYGKQGLFTKRYFGCSCGAKFSSELEYQYHYRLEQMKELCIEFADMSNKAHHKRAEALFFRRTLFVFLHGDKKSQEKLNKEFSKNGWGEGQGVEAYSKMLGFLMPIWQPIYDKRMKELEKKNA